MSKKTTNLQPWLDYFGMLKAYEDGGYLYVQPEKNVAYVAQSALRTLSGDDAATTDASLRRLRAYAGVVRRIRAYAGWKSTEGPDYLLKPFALHVVKDEQPHDLLCTILLELRRRWWSFWCKSDHFDVVTYTDGRTKP